MADIQILLDATKAIEDGERLDSLLCSLEKNARDVDKAFDKLKLKIKLDTEGVDKKFKAIKKRATDYSEKNPIILHARLSKKIAFVNDYKRIKRQISSHSKNNPIILHTKLS